MILPKHFQSGYFYHFTDGKTEINFALSNKIQISQIQLRLRWLPAKQLLDFRFSKELFFIQDSQASAVGEFQKGKKLFVFKLHSGKCIKWILP